MLDLFSGSLVDEIVTNPFGGAAFLSMITITSVIGFFMR